MLKSVEASYIEDLSSVERDFWSVVGGRERDAFRICRDFAMRSVPNELPPPLFYLSQGSLAERLGLFKASGCAQDEAGGRILRLFEDHGIIGTHLAGVKRALGTVGRATQYKWLLPTIDLPSDKN